MVSSSQALCIDTIDFSKQLEEEMILTLTLDRYKKAYKLWPALQNGG